MAYRDGFIGEGQISYAGYNAVARGQLALEIVRERLALTGVAVEELELSMIGIDAADRTGSTMVPREVRARVAARVHSLEAARQIGREVDALYTNGPSGGGGVQVSAREVIAVASGLIERNIVTPSSIFVS
jgi:hypothetical protein